MHKSLAYTCLHLVKYLPRFSLLQFSSCSLWLPIGSWVPSTYWQYSTDTSTCFTVTACTRSERSDADKLNHQRWFTNISFLLLFQFKLWRSRRMDGRIMDASSSFPLVPLGVVPYLLLKGVRTKSVFIST